jgi:flagellar biosynthesis protein FliR
VQELVNQLVAVMLLSLRFAPALAFAPPFTLLRIPASVRMVLAVALAGWAAAARPESSWASNFWWNGLPTVAATELFLGLSLALPLQLAFAMIAMMGRALDIQAGFGLSLLIDPTTRAQTPLIGTIFAYAAGAVFFMTDAPAQLFSAIATSVELVPLGAGGVPDQVTLLTGYLAATSVLSLGLIGLILLCLMLIDLTVAAISKTVPQMNVLLLGFQIKAIATLALLPISLALTASAFAEITRFALDSTLILVR